MDGDKTPWQKSQGQNGKGVKKPQFVTKWDVF